MKNCVLSLLGALLVSGCGITGTMIPVEGPLSKTRPVPVLQVAIDGILGNSGNLSFTMPGGERCAGKWSSAAGSGLSVNFGGLISKYGAVYGSGVTVSPGRGQNPGQALAVCDSGRTLQLEFVTGAGTASGYGFGKDNQENVYRFVF